MFAQELTVLRDTFRRLLRRHASANLRKLIEKTHPADMAFVFRFLSEEEQSTLFALMEPSEPTAEFLSELDESILTELLKDERPERIVEIIRQDSSNIRAHILGMLPDDLVNAVLERLQEEEQEEVEEIMAYPKDSAGALMDTDVFTLSASTLAREAIAALQDHAHAGMVFYLYVTDENQRLVGVISLRDLVTTAPDTQLDSIMVRNVHTVVPETDQEEVARILTRYNFLALPVVDIEGTLLGIVNVDEIVDVIREEATEDFLRMAGVGKDREILLKSTWENAKSRLPWLFASWLGGIVAATIIGSYEQTLEKVIALAAFIPVVIGMGGNIGTQSSTIIVRGIATGRVVFGNAAHIILKELRVGLLLGLFYGLLLGLVAHLQFLENGILLGVAVGLSVGGSMLLAATVGTFVPLILERMHIDPAIATGPFVTTSVDILGVLFYFAIATLLLSI
ncbi:MAG: magnesium transporter [Acidobacteriota bacterium]|nr:MAG: magnesium transporter [Acidobacteriota bacterium]